MNQNVFWILLSAMIINNFTLMMFLGLCPFMGVSGRVGTALRMGLANIFVLTITVDLRLVPAQLRAAVRAVPAR